MNNYKVVYFIDNRYYYTNDINKFINNKKINKITRLRLNNVNIKELPENLDNIKELIILHCNNINKIPIYKKLEKLHLYDCNNINEIEENNKLKKLIIHYCESLYNISNKFYELEELDIFKTNIINISNTYKKLKILKIDYNININNFPDEYYDIILNNYI